MGIMSQLESGRINNGARENYNPDMCILFNDVFRIIMASIEVLLVN